MNLQKLSKKFPEEDIEWRIQQSGKGGSNYWAMVIPYITNRAIMQRLDDAVGPGKWKNEYLASPCGTGYMCGISIKIDDEWVTRWDGAEKSGGSIDNVKTTMSNSMKRCGVQWGIGRYLYQFDTEFATVQHCDNRRSVQDGFSYHENKKKNERFQWKPPALKAWALPVTEKEVTAYIEAMSNAEDSKTLKGIFGMAYKAAVSENDDDMMQRFTKSKDAAKQRLIEKQEKEGADNYQLLCNEVKEQIKIITLCVNESTVNGMKDIAMGKIKNIAKGDILKQAMKEINQASANKINTLRN